MTRVLVNGLSARLGGGASVLNAHVEGLLAAGDEHLKVLVLVGDEAILRRGIMDDTRVTVLALPRLRRWVRAILEQVLVPTLGRSFKADVIYCIGNFGLLLPRRESVVVLLQNAHYFPSIRARARRDLYPWMRIARYEAESRAARALAARATRVACVSQTVAGAVRSDWPESADRVRLVRSVPAPLPRTSPFAKPLPRYCLFVANDYPHKQWRLVHEQFALASDLPPLLQVGMPSGTTADVRAGADVAAELVARRVVLLGAVKDRALLSALYDNATVVLVHSLTEAGPLTILEAMASGCRVAASDIPAHREAVGETEPGVAPVELYDPGDPRAMMDAVRAVLALPRTTSSRAVESPRTAADVGQDLLDVFAEAGKERRRAS